MMSLIYDQQLEAVSQPRHPAECRLEGGDRDPLDVLSPVAQATDRSPIEPR
jgi:hypothetical protein